MAAWAVVGGLGGLGGAGGLGGVQLGADGGLAGGLAGLTDLANAQAAQMTQAAQMPHADGVAQSADGATELERSTQPAGASIGVRSGSEPAPAWAISRA